ncbi:MAG TPA: heavy-metal-associated domain-containing protein [Edaphocola sp.]|nr:heavy-metal-associated domain-containing protein [Edaphocola sp.]
MKWRFLLFFFMALSATVPGKAQVLQAEVGVNGLTCSQCSRNVEMELRKLAFVQKVDMNLEHTSGVVLFKRGSRVSVAELAQAVVNAGFSTRYIRLTFDFKAIRPGRKCFTVGQDVFYFLQPLPAQHPEKMTFQVIGKGLLPKKALKQFVLTPAGDCRAKEKFYLKAI